LFELAVGHITRPKRENEEDGKQYHFIKKSEFIEEIAKNNFWIWHEDNGFYNGVH